jgi:hypothetical protein
MDPCDDGNYCNGTDTCAGGGCVIPAGDPCDDTNACTDDTCTPSHSGGDPGNTTADPSTGSCTNDCIATDPTEPCCDDAACAPEEVCQAGGIINIGEFWAACGDVGIKIPICLVNLAVPVGGLQMDICENPDRKCAGTNTVCADDDDCTGAALGETYDLPCLIDGADPDCLICTECEMTERTVLFDCVVTELPDGCCRLILFSKNPGGLINPGECDVVIIVYEWNTDLVDFDELCCDECIEIDARGIILSDEYGYDILGVMGELGSVCPYACGDIEPGCAVIECSDSGAACVEDADCPLASYPNFETCTACAAGEECGDGDVDIFDILLEVDFALGVKVPDDCQAGERSNVPTGTPPYCIAPDVNCSVSGVPCVDDSDCYPIPPPMGPDVCTNDLPKQIDILDIMVIIDMALDRQDCCSFYYAGIIW